jgi:hypothetical protein
MGDTSFAMHHVKTLATYGTPFLWGAVLFVYLNVTSPLQSGPLSVLVAFVLVYLFVSSAMYATVRLGIKIANFLGWKRSLPAKTVYYLVSVIGLGPVFMLALNTLGQLEIKDIILVILLLVVGCFYVLRRSRKEVS